MKDSHTKLPLQVVTHELAASRITVSQDDLDGVRKLLESHGIPYWVGHLAISHNGKPAVMKIYLRQGVDPKAVQELLDRTA